MESRLMSRLSLTVLALGMPAFAVGQARPAPPPNVQSTPQPPDTITRPGSVADSGPYGFWTQMTDQGRAGGALLGRVRIEGEPLLWEPILVSVVCKGKAVNTARTDPKGNFAFTSAPSVVSAQADGGRQMGVYYEGCRIEAALTGFRSDGVAITQRNLRDDPDLGTVWLRLVNGRTAGTAVSATSQTAPKKAAKLFEKAHAAMLERNPGQAQSDLEEAVRIAPEFAEAWYQLGKLQMVSGSQRAWDSFTKAAAADPQFVLPYEELAQLAVQSEKWKEAAANTGISLRLDPSGTPQVWYFDALAHYQLGELDVAKASALKELDLVPGHQVPNTEQLLAVILARQGDYEQSLQHLRNCMSYVKPGPGLDLLKQQMAQMERAVAQQKAKAN